MKQPARFTSRIGARIAPRLFIAILTILLIVQPVMARPLEKQTAYAPEADTGPTVFNIWYGPTQTFGTAGRPQNQVNILGTVSDPDGIATLTYSLDGGVTKFPLSVGPDTRRLYDPGDFNVELYYDDLSAVNTVLIEATDMAVPATVSTTTVTVNIVNGSASVPYSINWATVTNISNVAQVVDGKWSLTGSGVRSTQLGYDRLLGIGEMDWTNYEISVPVTVNAVVPNGFQAPSYGPALGIILGWSGHTDDPAEVGGMQPHEGYFPYGVIAAYRWEDESGENDGLKLYVRDAVPSADLNFTITEGATYIFKVRAELLLDGRMFYRFKAWESGAVEPVAWNAGAFGDPEDPTSGSILLQAHHVDATFGNVTVAAITDALGPTISSIVALPIGNAAQITWKTDEPSTSRVKYGTTTAYGLSVTDPALVTDHTVILSGLTASTLYHFSVGSDDQLGNKTDSVDQTFTTLAPGGASTIKSDDFNTCALNSFWTYTNPLPADSVQSLVGTFTADARLSIAVPAGTDHDLDTGENRAPRIMQPANNTDFELEAKFDSAVASQYQMQGMIVEQDPDLNYLRFEFYGDGTNVHIAAFKYVAGEFTPAGEDTLIPVGDELPEYIRVKRVGAQWTFSYSYDRLTWTESHNFNHVMEVKAVGAYGANAIGTESPAHTALVDYFFNTAAPIAQEDVLRNTLTIQKVGNGNVVLDKVKDAYGCNESVTLNATPAPGYKFAGWSGDITGIANPLLSAATVVMNGSRVITATFTAEEYTLTVTQPDHGTIDVNPVKAKYVYGDKVTLTATGETNWALDSWVINSQTDGSANPLVYTIVGSTTISATYTYSELKHTLTVNPVGQGSISITPAAGPYAHGAVVTITATPAPGWEFAGWSGSQTSSDNPLVLTMSREMILTATFTQMAKDNMIFIPVIVSE